MSTLQSRLQDQDYKNWVKAGLCLAFVKEGLEDFADSESKKFHYHVLATVANGNINTAGCTVCHTETISFRRPRMTISCHHPFCQAFIDAIVREGLDPNQRFTISRANLANTNVQLWASDPWELAKLFMHPGQGPTQTSPRETCLSGILNFLEHCQIPRRDILNIQNIEMVRRARNSIMHTADMRLSETDFMTFTQSMVDLLTDQIVLAGLPCAQNAVSKILQIRKPAFQIEPKDEIKDLDHLVATLKTDIEYIKTDSSSMQQHDNDTRDKKTLEDLLEQLLRIQDITARVAFTVLSLVKRVTESKDETVRKIGSEAGKLHSTLEKAREELWYQSRNIQRQLDELETKQTDTGARRDTLEEPASDDKLGKFKLIKHPTEGEKVPTGRAESPKEVALDVSVTTDEKPKPVEEEVSFEIEETIDETPKTEEMIFDIQIETTPKKEEAISEEIERALKPREEEDVVEMVLEEAVPKPKGRAESPLDISVKTDEKPKPVEKEVSFEFEETIGETPKKEKMTFDIETTPKKEEDISEEIELTLKPIEEEVAVEMVLEEAVPKPKEPDGKAIYSQKDTSLFVENEIFDFVKVQLYINKKGKDSKEVDAFLQWLCTVAERTYKDAESVWLGYDSATYDAPAPAFVILVRSMEASIDVTNRFSTFEVVKRHVGEVSEEASYVAELERTRNLSFSEDESVAVQDCLTRHAKDLMMKHSNLLIISASKLKSTHWRGCEDNTIREETCIVLYVQVKGIIPFGEEPFEEMLDSFPIDVRESMFENYTKQSHLMAGCEFKTEYDTFGTLGGFVELQSGKIGGLTCCHIFQTTANFKIFEKLKVKPDMQESIKSSVYKNFEDQEHHSFGRVKKWINYLPSKEGITVDAALIEIETRHPESWCIPNSGEYGPKYITKFDVFVEIGKLIDKLKKWRKEDLEQTVSSLKGFVAHNPKLLDSGDIVESFEMFPNGCFVVKYGAETKLTIGKVWIKRVSEREIITQSSRGKSELFNQIEIRSVDNQPFCKKGDSGSMVFAFIREEGTTACSLKALGLLVGGTTTETEESKTGVGQRTFITPIWAVLSMFDLSTPLKTLSFRVKGKNMSTIQRIKTLEKDVVEMKSSIETIYTKLNESAKSKDIDELKVWLVNNFKTQGNTASGQNNEEIQSNAIG